uniref:Protein kinase domain-containing protein n=1 Tax=Trieres chinensis TaxID=1514140 RepID=A0A7S1ZMN4_TRICV
MMLANDNDTRVKLADFGLSSRITAPNCLMRLCGSPYYVAPEIITRTPYGRPADMWSAGAIIYLLLGGSVPFKGSSLSEIFERIADGRFQFPPEYWDVVSDEAKDLVRGLLTLDPTQRLTAAQAAEHPWFKLKGRALARRDLSRTGASLGKFDARMKFKGAVLMVQGAQRLVGNWNYDAVADSTGSVVIKEPAAEEEKEECP